MSTRTLTRTAAPLPNDAQLLADYSVHLHNNFAELTVLRRDHTLRHFLAFVVENDPGHEALLVEVEQRDIEDYMNRPRAYGPGGLARSTRWAYLMDLRAFYQWAAPRYHFDDPTALVRVPKMDAGRPRPVPDEAIRDTLAYCDAIPTMAPAALAIRLAYYLGLRCFECASITRGDVVVDEDSGEPWLEFVGKGAKEARLPIPDTLRPYLLDGGRADRRYIAMVSNSLSRLVSRAFTRAGHDGWTLHKVRHSFGTRIYNATRDIVWTSEMLRHSSIATTQVYAKSGRSGAAAHGAMRELPDPLADDAA